jgi:hypothetical protein
MAIFKMKCPECSHEFSGESTIEFITCPSCNKELSVNQAIKYYETLHKRETEKKKVAIGEAYIKVQSLISECEWYVKNGDYETALNLTEEALKLSTTESKIYLMRVYIKTKNFTDYDDKTHYGDLKKAIELSPIFEQEQIRELYAPYYKKTTISKEELDEYESQEANSRLARVEELLKDSIPKHFRREKFVKFFLLFEIPIAIAFITLLVLSLVFENTILSLSSAGTLVLAVALLLNFIEYRKKTASFNAVLDFYDNLSNFELSSKSKLRTALALEKLAVSEINNEASFKKDSLFEELIGALIEGKEKKALRFIIDNKTFSKYIEKSSSN